MPELRRLLIGDEPDAWSAAGFKITERETSIGTIAIEFVAGHSPGVIGWQLTDIADGSIDGIESTGTEAEPAPVVTHDNAVTRLDHVVITTPDLDRTITALETAGFSARRTRDVPTAEPPRRQVFLWAGETILEVVGPAEPTGADPATIWGLALTTDDMDAAVASIGPNLKPPKQAVQPGRQIATVNTRALGIGMTMALMTPHVTPTGPGEG